MTAPKQPVLLTVLIESIAQRWCVASISGEGEMEPLVCSEPGNLSAYAGEEFDEQVSFLRHRLSGVLQRGCDRLWGRNKKPRQIVFVADGPFPEAPPQLAQAVADHFVEWMTSPPVAFYVLENLAESGEPELRQLAGQVAEEDLGALRAGLRRLLAASADTEAWEVIATPMPNSPSR